MRAYVDILVLGAPWSGWWRGGLPMALRQRDGVILRLVGHVIDGVAAHSLGRATVATGSVSRRWMHMQVH